MNRRDFLQLGGAALAVAAWAPRRARAAADWRAFELTTSLEVQHPSGPTRAWVPLPLGVDTDYQTHQGNQWVAPGGTAKLHRDPRYGVNLLAVEWPAGVKPVVEVKSRVMTRDRAVDVGAAPRAGLKLEPAERALYTAPTHLIPVDGIVASTARKITTGVKDEPIARALAVYEWIVENTFRDPKVAGCGVGDIKSMLDHDTLGGKCADLNSLFVGFMRSLGVPARDVYGIRLAPSRRGYTALGKSGDVTKGQHCRAEFFADGHGWIPADPADVRKLVLEEPPGNLAMDDPRVAGLRATLFGGWEMNWMAYNTGHDVALPGASKLDARPFLMYPQAETDAGAVDCLDAAGFKYSIAARLAG